MVHGEATAECSNCGAIVLLSTMVAGEFVGEDICARCWQQDFQPDGGDE